MFELYSTVSCLIVVVREVSIRARLVQLTGGLMAAPGQTSDLTVI